MKKRMLSVALTVAMLMISALPAYASGTAQAPAAVSSETVDSGVTPRGRAYVDATIAAGQTKVYGPTAYYISNRGGIVLGVRASSGPSFYGLYNRDTGVFYPIVYNTSGKMYRGTIYAPVNGNYSLAIQNASSQSITYNGFFDY